VTRILIIMPALNEEESLPATLKELREVVDDHDVLVIDDGSTDATAEVARRAGAVSAQLPFTLGVGGAVRVGLHYAQRNGYDRAVVIDADGQHDPAGITALLEALDRGADMAVGSRFAAGTREYPVGRVRRQAMRFLATIVRALTGQRFSDVTSGFRAFDRPVIELLARDYPVEYLADTVEALLIVRYAGFRVDEVPISMRVRAAGVPSTRRIKLVINYLRLLIGILGSASRRARLRKDEP
jgi:glycosyltransferase involved in cell wall biosynthesis